MLLLGGPKPILLLLLRPIVIEIGLVTSTRRGRDTVRARSEQGNLNVNMQGNLNVIVKNL